MAMIPIIPVTPYVNVRFGESAKEQQSQKIPRGANQHKTGHCTGLGHNRHGDPHFRVNYDNYNDWLEASEQLDFNCCEDCEEMYMYCYESCSKHDEEYRRMKEQCDKPCCQDCDLMEIDCCGRCLKYKGIYKAGVCLFESEKEMNEYIDEHKKYF